MCSAQAGDGIKRNASSRYEAPDWAFPSIPPSPAVAHDSITPVRVPGSARAYTAAQLYDYFSVPDWHPGTHGEMPFIVAHGRKPAVIACAYCHLPDGTGRPENAELAGLPAGYIERQVLDMKAGRRHSPVAYRPATIMKVVADSTSSEQIHEAALYFSRLRANRKSTVVEADTIPRPMRQLGLYFPDPSGAVEPLGTRLIEMPVDAWRHEARDSRASYVAYVPRGSLRLGRTLSMKMREGGAAPCAVCHGEKLRGGVIAPPIAGRSPSYLLRQLIAFKTGARAGTESAPMRIVTGRLTDREMIALAAYVGSLKP